MTPGTGYCNGLALAIGPLAGAWCVGPISLGAGASACLPSLHGVHHRRGGVTLDASGLLHVHEPYADLARRSFGGHIYTSSRKDLKEIERRSRRPNPEARRP